MLYFLYEVNENQTDNVNMQPQIDSNSNSTQNENEKVPQEVIVLNDVISKWIYIDKIEELIIKLSHINKKINSKEIEKLINILNDVKISFKYLNSDALKFIYYDLVKTSIKILKNSAAR